MHVLYYYYTPTYNVDEMVNTALWVCTCTPVHLYTTYDGMIPVQVKLYNV